MSFSQIQHPKYFLNFGILLTEAIAACNRCRAESKGKMRRPGGRQGLVSIVFSTASTEAFINDLPCMLRAQGLLQDPVAGLIRLIDTLEIAELCRASIQDKYHTAKRILTGEAFDKGIHTFQHFSLLLRARNSLVHMRPEEVPPPGQWCEEAERFRALQILSEDYPDANPHFMAALDTPAFAGWACVTAWNMMNAVASSLPPCPIRDALSGLSEGREQAGAT